MTDNKVTEGGKLCNFFVNINVIEVECVVSFPSIIFMFTKNFKTFHPQSLYCQSSIIINYIVTRLVTRSTKIQTMIFNVGTNHIVYPDFISKQKTLELSQSGIGFVMGWNLAKS